MLLVIASLSLGACGLGGTFVGWSGPALSGNNVYVGSRGGNLVALDVLTGDPVGTFSGNGEPLGALYGTPSVGSVAGADTLFFGALNGRVYALNADALKVQWQFPRGQEAIGPIFGGAYFSRDTSTVYVGSKDGKLYVLDAETGGQQRSHDTGSEIWSTPAVVGGVVYFGTMDGSLMALREDGGGPRELFKAGGAIASSPVVTNGIVYVGSFDKKFYAINAANGQRIWAFEAENWFWAQALLDDFRDSLYVGSLDGKIYALNINTGGLIWSFQAEQGIRSKAVLIENLVVVGSRDGKVYALDSVTGQKRWEFDAGARILAPLSTDGQRIYVSTVDDTLFALSSQGSELWRKSISQ